MTTTALPLRQLCALAESAARAAGRYIQSIDIQSLQQEYKDAGSSSASQIVTEVDRHSETIIREQLQDSCARWNLAFVGEESTLCSAQEHTARFHKPYFWCVDPLDGTLPFVQGRPGYAVSIALVTQAGLPLIGVVYDPSSERLLSAIRDQGLIRGARPQFEPHSEHAPPLKIFADASFKAQCGFDTLCARLNHSAQQAGLNGIDIVCGSGAVKNALQTLEHESACYLKLPKPEDGGGSIWDFAASACIVREAGGWASDIGGQPLDLNRRDSSFMNHRGVLYASSENLAQTLLQALDGDTASPFSD